MWITFETCWNFINNNSICPDIKRKRTPIPLHSVFPGLWNKVKNYFSSVGSPCRFDWFQQVIECFGAFQNCCFIWLERGPPLVRSEYRKVSERCMIVKMNANWAQSTELKLECVGLSLAVEASCCCGCKPYSVCICF